jgi:hypothetical protein
MSALATGLAVFGCVFGGALLGLGLRSVVPSHHRSADSKDVVRLGMGLLATMAALVLSLLVASAKSSYDTQSTGLAQLAGNVTFLDRVLAHYGPEAKEARDLLRRSVEIVLDQLSSGSGAGSSDLDPSALGADGLYEKIQALSPQNDAQRGLRADALRILIDIGRTRALLLAQAGSSIPWPFLGVLVFWVTAIFASFGFFAPSNATVIATLFVCALSVSTAIFLILELDEPFHGLLRISDVPLRSALATLGR